MQSKCINVNMKFTNEKIKKHLEVKRYFKIYSKVRDFNNNITRIFTNSIPHKL